MSVNVLGGSLEFDAILNTESFQQAIAALDADMWAAIQKLATEGNTITKIWDDMEKQIKEAAAADKAFNDAFSKATDAGKVKLLIDQMAKLNAQVVEMARTSDKVHIPGVEKVTATPISSPVSADAAEQLTKLKTQMEVLEQEEIKLQQALERTLDPGLIRQYNAALDSTIAKMAALGKEISELRTNNPQLSAGNAIPTPQATPTTPATPEQDPTEAVKKQLQAYQELQQLRNKLASMDKSDPAFKATFDQAVKLQGKINDVNKSLQLFSRGTAGLQALTGAVRGVVAGFEVWNGILGITADQNDEVQQAVTRAVSAMSVLQGIQEVVALFDKQNAANLYLTNLLRKESAISTEAQATATEGLAAAEEVQAGATEAATVAQVELNTAMEANPVGVLLLGLTGIVIALQAFSSSQKDATEEQIKANEAAAAAADILNKLVDLQRQVYDERARDTNNAVGLAQAQGKSEKEVLDLKLKALEAEKQANVFALAGLGYSKQEYGLQHAKLEDLYEQVHAYESVIINGGELTKESQKQLDNLNAQIKALEAQYGPLTKILDSQKAITAEQQRLQAEGQRKQAEADLRSAQALADAKLTLTKKNTQEELDAQIKAIETRRDNDLKNVNLTAAEMVNIWRQADKQIDDAQKTFQATQLKDIADAAEARQVAARNGTQAELNAEIAAIHARAQAELAADGLLAGAKELILAREKEDVAEVERQKRLLVLSNQKETLQTQLDLVEQGSQQELNLKLQLVQNEASAEIIAAQGNAAKIARINADMEKAQADLRRKYALDASQVDVETIISGINTRMAAVEKGSQDELALKKQLVDEEARLDILQAEERIRNEQQLWQKILEINAVANARRKKLDDDYFDHLLDRQIQTINKQTDLENIPLHAISSNPLSSPAQQYQAQRQSIQNEIDATQRELDLVHNNISLRRGDLTTLDSRLTDLRAKMEKLKADANNVDNNEQLRKQRQLIQDFSDISGALQGLSSAVQGIDEGAAHAIETFSKFASAASKGLAAVGDFAAAGEDPTKIVSGVVNAIGAIGDFIGGIFGGSGEPAISLAQVKEMQTQALIGEIEITRQYDQRLVDQAKLNKLRLEGIRQETEALKQQATDTQKLFDDLLAQIQKEKGTRVVNNPFLSSILGTDTPTLQSFSLAGLTYDQLNELFIKGELSDKAKELFEELQKLHDAGADIDQQLADAADQMKQIFTGTTADDIASSIIDGFKQGKRSVSDFADDFQQLMENAMLSALQSQTLEPALQQFYDQFAAFGQSDGVLTNAEIEELRKQYADILNNASDQFQQLQQIAGINLSSQTSGSNSLSGAIKGITAEQAELLAGQFGGLRLTAMDQLNIVTRQFQVLQDIQRDTSNLPEMKDILRYFKLNGIKISG